MGAGPRGSDRVAATTSPPLTTRQVTTDDVEAWADNGPAGEGFVTGPRVVMGFGIEFDRMRRCG